MSAAAQVLPLIAGRRYIHSTPKAEVVPRRRGIDHGHPFQGGQIRDQHTGKQQYHKHQGDTRHYGMRHLKGAFQFRLLPVQADIGQDDQRV